MARPSKFSEARAEAILTALRAGNTRTASAGYAEIDRSTFTTWLHRYPTFLAAVEKAESDAEVAMVANIRKAVNDGTWTAAAWWLERRRYQDWGKVDRVELTIKQVAERLAAELDCTAEELIAEAEAIVAGVKRG